MCTEPFVQVAKVNAAGRGIPELDLIVIPHPLGTRAPHEIDELGRPGRNARA